MLKPNERPKAIREAGALYKKGRSIREIASLMHVSYGHAHKLVTESGATMRSRGGPNRTKGK